MPAFSLRSHSPDDAATDCGDNIKLQLCSVYIENFLTNQTSRGLLSVAHITTLNTRISVVISISWTLVWNNYGRNNKERRRRAVN